MYKYSFAILVSMILLIGGIILGIWYSNKDFTEHQIKEIIISTIQQDADTSFYVTGYIEMDTEINLEDTKILWPGISLGTTKVSLRVPGKVSYGFPIEELTEEEISVQGDTVYVTIPEPHIYSIEPYLEKMMLKTEVGWARTHANSGQVLESKAWKELPIKMRRQAEAHLARSDEPFEHTKIALSKLLIPVFHSSGIEPVTLIFEKQNSLQEFLPKG